MFFFNYYNLLSKLKEIKKEFLNVSWPDRKEINQTILIVVFLILLTSIVLWIVDTILINLISKII